MSLRVLVLVAFLAALMTSAAAAQSPSLEVGRFIVVLSPSASPSAVAAAHERRFASHPTHLYRHALRGYAAQIPVKHLESILADDLVEYVAPDLELHAAAQVLPTGVNRIDGDLSSTASGNGSGTVTGVNVAVLDSGIQSSHPDLSVAGGFDCTAGKASFEDDAFHGTMVAGVIGARDDSSGVVGVAPGVALWAVKVLKRNGAGTVSQIVCGVDWVTGTRSDSNPANDIDVANLSLGGKGADDGACGDINRDALHAAICASVAAGVVYVASAMNDAADVAGVIPAAYDEVLTVTAIADLDGQPGARNGRSCNEDDDTPADFSNFARAVDASHTIAGPGVCITSTTLGSQYRTASGTSFAAPHVAGTVALCIAAGPCAGLSSLQLVQRIMSDAAAFNQANPGYGFAGDPGHGPDAARQYGYLIRAGLY